MKTQTEVEERSRLDKACDGTEACAPPERQGNACRGLCGDPPAVPHPYLVVKANVETEDCGSSRDVAVRCAV